MFILTLSAKLMHKGGRYLLVFAVLLLGACSNKAIYSGLQSSQRVECSSLPDAEYRRCMQQANKSYEEYEQQRKQLLEQ